jgi:hypothetical protein
MKNPHFKESTMHCKKNLMLLLAVFVLALPLIFTGTASAKYYSDGSGYDGTNGVFVAPTDGVCVKSLAADGTMVIIPGITNKRDCDAQIFAVTAATPGDTLANVCVKGASNTDGVRYAAPGSNNCVSVDGSGYITGGLSMKDLDRGAVMCSTKGGQLGNASAGTLSNGAVISMATKTVANGTSAMCTAYGWQYSYQDASGTPLTFGPKGVTPAASGTGFCYTSIRTGITPTTSCPSNTAGSTVAAANAKLGYSVSGSNCLYAYGTSGVANAALTNAVNGAAYAAAGATVDLRTLTQGECLANGASWGNGWGFVTTGNTYGTSDGWTAGTGVKFDVTKNVQNADDGCLHCHSYTSQQNGPAERFKDSYLKTGHKNMLRKVSAGKIWKGPDDNGVLQTYTAWGTTGQNPIDFNLATTTVGTTTYPLLYIFGDWMAPAPAGLDVIVNNGGFGKYNATSNYSCAACHTTGWGNNDPTAGLCNKSSYTTAATCTTNGGVWTPVTGVQAIATTDYAGIEPNASYPAVTFTGAGQWDLEGITCARCHNAVNSATSPSQTQINGSQFPTTYAPATGMGTIPGGPAAMSTYSTYLCFGCHQSMAKTSNGTGADADLAHPENLIVKNNATAPAYTPGFSGHVIGNSFLNSVHARATAVVKPNSLGKYDVDIVSSSSTSIKYNSTFQGFTCWQSASSSSPAKTKADGTEIKDKATCESLYGVGAWRSDVQGSCTTCHDVHNSLFVAGQEGMRKECDDCHANSDFSTAVPGTPQATAIAHPTGANTPAALDPVSPCVICHMPKPTAADFPMHVWRINTDANYSTFPTATEFGIGATATLKNARAAVDDKGYANAVWVDLDLACGQCHYSTGLNYVAGNPMFNKTQLSAYANILHDTTPVTDNSLCLNCHSTAQGTKRAINQGVDHHNGTCTVCHPAANGHFQSAWVTAGVAAPNINATTATLQSRETPTFYYWAINSSLRTACLGCHANPVTRESDHATLGAIIPSGAGDNHHQGHSGVPGTSFGGVAEIIPGSTTNAGSRGDNDPGMYCLGCHGKANIVSGSTSTGYAMTFAASGLSTSTVAAANGRVDTKGLCLGCHELIQSGPTQDHHNGNCTTCHHPDGTWSGTYPAGVTDTTTLANLATAASQTVPGTSASCLNCHKNDVTSVISGATLTAIKPAFGPGKNHHGAVPGETDCMECHGEAGGVPASFGGYPYTNYNMCLSCHQNYPYANALVPGVSHHYDITGQSNCTTCHSTTSPLDGSKITGPGVIPVVTNCEGCHIAGQHGWSGYINHNPIASTRTEQCQKCHDSSGVVSGVTYTNNAGITPTGDALIQVACGQCHGGSETSTTTNGAPYKTFAQLSQRAAIIHTQTVPPTAGFVWTNSATTDYAVDFDASASTCPSGTCTYAWSTGEAGVTMSHTFADSTPTAVTLTVTDSVSGSATASQTVTPKYVGANPTSLSMSASVSGYTVSGTYSVSGGIAPYTVTGKWGDGTVSALSGGTFSHTYVSAGTYTVNVTAIDSGVNGSNKTSSTQTQVVTISAAASSISGTVTKADGTTPLASAVVLIKGTSSFVQVTKADGTYTQGSLKPGTYTVTVTKSGYTFPTSPTNGVAPGSVVNFKSTQ